jgi:hypothetical protein
MVMCYGDDGIEVGWDGAATFMFTCKQQWMLRPRATQMMCRAYDGNGRYAFTYAREKCYTVTVGYVAEVLLDVM